MNDKAELNDSTSVVYLPEELTNQLQFAFFGLPKATQAKVEEDVKAGTPRNQAIFNAIVHQRITMYANAGKRIKDDEISKALYTLRALGMSEEEIQTKLKRIK